MCKSVDIDGELYMDGGLSDPIPIEKAIEDGCDKVILILTKQRENYLTPVHYSALIKSIPTKSVYIKSLALSMHEKCKKALEIAEKYEKEGKVIILEPKDCFGMKTLTNDTDAIMKMYQSGYEDAKKAMEAVKAGSREQKVVKS